MDIAHVASTLSELNLMTYDFHGAFSETTGINAPLYYQGWGEEDFSVHDCVNNWLAGGGTRDKINIGLPFYGRSFLSATGLNQPHDGADKTTWGIDDGTPQYFNIVAQLPYMTSIRQLGHNMRTLTKEGLFLSTMKMPYVRKYSMLLNMI